MTQINTKTWTQQVVLRNWFGRNMFNETRSYPSLDLTELWKDRSVYADKCGLIIF